MATIQEIKTDLDAALADYRAVAQTAPAADVAGRVANIKGLQAALAAAIAEGAQDCPKCEIAPHGMEQPKLVGRRTYTFYEIGCLSCDRRVLEATREAAVEAWNAAQYLEPAEA